VSSTAGIVNQRLQEFHTVLRVVRVATGWKIEIPHDDIR
jgi:hypothetical protein